jgi:hypothetical protein
MQAKTLVAGTDSRPIGNNESPPHNHTPIQLSAIFRQSHNFALDKPGGRIKAMPYEVLNRFARLPVSTCSRAAAASIFQETTKLRASPNDTIVTEASPCGVSFRVDQSIDKALERLAYRLPKSPTNPKTSQSRFRIYKTYIKISAFHATRQY